MGTEAAPSVRWELPAGGDGSASHVAIAHAIATAIDVPLMCKIQKENKLRVTLAGMAGRTRVCHRNEPRRPIGHPPPRGGGETVPHLAHPASSVQRQPAKKRRIDDQRTGGGQKHSLKGEKSTAWGVIGEKLDEGGEAAIARTGHAEGGRRLDGRSQDSLR